MTKIFLYEKKEMTKEVGQRTRYIFKQGNDKDENIVVELSHCNLNNSIGKVWKRKKYISKDLKNWISVDVYVHDKEGNCWGKYNPQHKENHKINFDWVLEDTPANRTKILIEIAKLAKIKEV